MRLANNDFRDALRAGRPQIGLWVGLADANAAELLAGSGFDWLVLDGEHAPNDVRSLLSQLRAVAPYPVHPVLRPVRGDVELVKQFLDIGAQTLLIPMIDTPQQAALMVSAMRYPPAGIRGMGAVLARASRWSQVENYADQADAQMCLLVQAETVTAMHNLDAIAAVNGVDGVFFGPADLSASMGYRGQANHPEVQRVILDGIARVRAAGKAAGVLTSAPDLARLYLDAGALFVAVGVDTAMLTQAATALAQRFKGPDSAGAPAGTGAPAHAS